MKAGWESHLFSDVIADVSAGNCKVPQSGYLESGNYAVVDQGKRLISGYVDDHQKLCRSASPAIVFGDHTRCIKYVDFPFCMGADGVKILRPKVDADVKYLFHFLRQVRISNQGYDRHFKYLKRSKILLPPREDQERIAAILDLAEALRAKRRQALAKLDALAQSLFIDLFGDPISNPKHWPSARFEEVCQRVTVGIVVRPASYYVSEGVPALRSLNIRPGKIILQDLVYFSKIVNETKLNKTMLKAGDLVLVRSGQPGTAAVIPRELDGVNAIDLLIATPLPKVADVIFLCEFFNSAGGRDIVLSRQRGQIQKHLNVGALNSALIPLPPIELQREFARRITALEKLKTAKRASLVKLDALFAILQHRAFRGEL